MNPLISLGFERPLEIPDMYSLPDVMKAEYVGKKFDMIWKHEVSKKKLKGYVP
jgi:hypothetical protein